MKLITTDLEIFISTIKRKRQKSKRNWTKSFSFHLEAALRAVGSNSRCRTAHGPDGADLRATVRREQGSDCFVETRFFNLKDKFWFWKLSLLPFGKRVNMATLFWGAGYCVTVPRASAWPAQGTPPREAWAQGPATGTTATLERAVPRWVPPALHWPPAPSSLGMPQAWVTLLPLQWPERTRSWSPTFSTLCGHTPCIRVTRGHPEPSVQYKSSAQTITATHSLSTCTLMKEHQGLWFSFYCQARLENSRMKWLSQGPRSI